MQYQFIHINTYSGTKAKVKTRSGAASTATGWSSADAVGEALRQDGHCPHVAVPQAPVYLYGVSLEETLAISTAWAATERDPCVLANGSTVMKKLRTDAQALMAGVVSAPPSMSDNEWALYRSDALTWLEQTYGARLKSVIEHVDEKERHIHFYVVPNPGERMTDLHPGSGAQTKFVKDWVAAGGKKTDKNVIYEARGAYKDAMAKFQTDWHAQVASKHGMDKLGPRRQRLTRKEWTDRRAVQVMDVAARTAAAVAASNAFDLLNGVGLEVATGQAELTKAYAALDVVQVQVASLDQNLTIKTDLMQRATTRSEVEVGKVRKLIAETKAAEVKLVKVQAEVADTGAAALAFVEAKLNTKWEAATRWLSLAVKLDFTPKAKSDYNKTRLVVLEQRAAESNPGMGKLIKAFKATLAKATSSRDVALKLNEGLTIDIAKGREGYISTEAAAEATAAAVAADHETLTLKTKKIIADWSSAYDQLNATIAETVAEQVAPIMTEAAAAAASNAALVAQVADLTSDLEAKQDAIHKLHVAAGGYFQLNTYTGKTDWVVVAE